MAPWARAKLAVAAAWLLLALLPWPAQAGTQADPELTDDAGDTAIAGVVPIGVVFPVSDGVDLLNGWVEENATHLILALEVGGEITLFDPLLTYDFTFHFNVNGTDQEATAAWADGFTAGGAATGLAFEGSVLRLHVPKAAVGAFRGDAITGLFAESSGTLVTAPLSSAVDRAPDTGTGRAYNVTQGFARGGSSSDVDGDGLPDDVEVAKFGSIGAQDGTGDPDGDGLNNSREVQLGTDPADDDTDGDLVRDGADPFPLDASRPADADGDNLTDSWERRYFTTIDAQDDEGDPDADGLHNHDELELGTDPTKADTDGDGVEDGDDSAPLDPDAGAGGDAEGERFEPEPELYAGAGLFAVAATFILLGLAKGL